MLPSKNDHLEQQATNLVVAANIFAIGAFNDFSRAYPLLKDPKRWDFTVTIAGIFIALTLLNDVKLDEARKQVLLDRVTASLMKEHPTTGLLAIDHCKADFEQTYAALASAGHEPRFVASDAIGLWIASECLGRRPESQQEIAMARAVGVGVTHSFFDWWT